MNRMRLFTSVLLFVAAVLGDSVEFVSPGPSVSTSNPSISNAVHPIRSNFHVAWSGTNSSRAVSIVLFQYDGKELVYPFEYILQTATNVTSTDWTVVTNKNLSFSNLFLFNLFYDGETSPVAVSETFNITDDWSSGTSATSPTGSGATSAATSASAAAAAAATTTTTTTTGAVSNQSGGLSTGAKVGIGIAAPVVALGGIAAGYYCLLRRRAGKKQQDVAPGAPPAAERSPAPQAPAEQKPDDLAAELAHERPAYELHGQPDGPAMMHELSGDATRR